MKHTKKINPKKINISRGSKTKIVNNRSAAVLKNERKLNHQKKSVLFFNVLIAIVVIICLAGALRNFASVAQRQERLDVLEREHNSVRIQNEALRNQIEKSREIDQFDEDHVISVARAHGLRKDSDIIFHISAGGE